MDLRLGGEENFLIINLNEENTERINLLPGKKRRPVQPERDLKVDFAAS